MKKNRKGFFVLVVGLLGVLYGQVSLSAVLYVGSGGNCAGKVPCFSTIQSAVDGASPGDEISILAGRYSENLDLKSGITLKGESRETTILAASQPGPPVIRAVGVSDVRISGLTITGGRIADYMFDEDGQGIWCKNSSVTIADNVIRDNISWGGGSGIFCEDSTVVIQRNLVEENKSFDWDGAGICILGGSAEVAGNVLRKNSTPDAGGGIRVDGARAKVHSNTFQQNSADYGGGIYTVGPEIQIYNNVIEGNGALYGGAIFNGGGSKAFNNTVVGNTNPLVCEGDAPPLFNSIFWENRWDDGWFSDSCRLENSIVDWETNGPGLQNVDPSFTGTGDYRLRPGSPAIDAGTHEGIPADLATDMSGNPRISDGNGDGTAVIDLGALEAKGGSCLPIQLDIFPLSSFNTVLQGRTLPLWAAALGSSTINASSIDPQSVRLAGAAPGRYMPVRLLDINRDGFRDFLFQVNTSGMQLTQGSFSAAFSANLKSGGSVCGSDQLNVVSPLRR